MVHKPEHKVHSFRGLLGDGAQDEINLERQNVNLAYRIVKFQLMPYQMGVAVDSMVKVFREEQTSINGIVDFTDTDLLAAGANYNATYEIDHIVVFDNILFSRNIFITHHESTGSSSVNYYIELEEVPVGAATLMQLKLATARKLSLTQ